MRVHLFRAQEFGYEEKRFGIYFDSAEFTKEEAEAQFVPYQARSQRGYTYTGYECCGHKYYKYSYIGEMDKRNMPRNDWELLAYNLRKK